MKIASINDIQRFLNQIRQFIYYSHQNSIKIKTNKTKCIRQQLVKQVEELLQSEFCKQANHRICSWLWFYAVYTCVSSAESAVYECNKKIF